VVNHVVDEPGKNGGVRGGVLSVVWQPNMLSRNVLHRAQIRR
jgi:hypothetical protein